MFGVSVGCSSKDVRFQITTISEIRSMRVCLTDRAKIGSVSTDAMYDILSQDFGQSG